MGQAALLQLYEHRMEGWNKPLFKPAFPSCSVTLSSFVSLSKVNVMCNFKEKSPPSDIAAVFTIY